MLMDRTQKVHILHKLLIQSKYPVHISRILEELKCSEKTFFRVRRKVEELYGQKLYVSMVTIIDIGMKMMNFIISQGYGFHIRSWRR